MYESTRDCFRASRAGWALRLLRYSCYFADFLCGLQLSKLWKDRLPAGVSACRTFDVQDDLSLATLDAIGLASFDVDFGCLSMPDHEIAKAYRGFL